MRYIPIVIAALVLASCASTIGRYTGDEYYYTGADDTRYSCREPKPFPGGNCKRESEWSKQGLN